MPTAGKPCLRQVNASPIAYIKQIFAFPISFRELAPQKPPGQSHQIWFIYQLRPEGAGYDSPGQRPGGDESEWI